MTSSLSLLFALPGRLSRRALSPRGLLSVLSAAWRRPGGSVLDPEVLSDAQKRDLGLLDGRGPPQRRPERDPCARR